MPAEVTGAINFYLEIDGITEGLFKEVSGGDIEIEVIEHRVSTKSGEGAIYKIPGNTKYSNITMRRGKTDDKKFADWVKGVVDKGVAGNRKNGSITGKDRAGNTVYKVNFINGWPCKYKGVNNDAAKNEYALEEVELAVEKIEHVSG